MPHVHADPVGYQLQFMARCSTAVSVAYARCQGCARAVGGSDLHVMSDGLWLE
jgi:hypothetical protein